MRNFYRLSLIMVVAIGLSMPTGTAQAQMNILFDSVFKGILVDQLALSDQDHHNHFIDAADLAAQNLSPAMNRMITQNLSALPLSSAIAGTFYESTNDGLKKVRTSWGPIFAETGATLGKKGLNIGVTYTSLGFQQFRGTKTKDLGFTFTHKDMENDDGPLGAQITESDVIDVVMDMDIDSDVVAFTGTYGISSKFDIGFAVPFISLTIAGDARATINSFTYANLGEALHHFKGGAEPDPFNPILETTESYSESVSGIGDVALRAKYSLKNTRAVQYGMLFDLRLPTGAEEDFLGTGETNMKVMGIYSRTIDRFSPHINLAYGYRGAEAESDEISFAVGFDQSIASSASFAFDILGLLPLDADKTASIAPGSTTIVDRPVFDRSATRIIPNSNVPEYERDNIVDASFGFRVAPFDNSIIQANVLVPMNDGGLRSSVTTTLGLTMYR